MNNINTKKTMERQSGFTLLEILVAVSLFIIIMILTGTLFTISQKAYTTGANQSELSQNARVIFDRMSREIRQSPDIITDLPASSTEAVNEIFFKNGHDSANTTYVRYYLDGNDLIRTHEAYYFLSDPDTYVNWDDVDYFGNTTTKIILDASDNIVGEHVADIRIWGETKIVNLAIDFLKGLNDLNMTTTIYGRN